MAWYPLNFTSESVFGPRLWGTIHQSISQRSSHLSRLLAAENHTGDRRVGPEVLKGLLDTQRSQTWLFVAEQ